MLYGIISGATAGFKPNIIPASRSLNLSGQVPNVVATVPININRLPNPASLLLSAAAPTRIVTGLGAPAAGALNLSSAVPVLASPFTPQTALTQVLPNDNVGGGGGFSIRAAVGITVTGTHMRITYTAASTGGFAVNHSSVGVRSTTYNTVATPIEFTFSGGSSGFSITAGQTITSDWIPFAPLVTDVLVVVSDLGASPVSKTASSGSIRWFLAATSSYNQATPAGSWTTDSLKTYFTTLEIY